MSFALAAVLFIPVSLSAQSGSSARSGSSDSVEVSSGVRRFLTAFENLEWEPFHSAFSDSATIFHPAPIMPALFSGRAAIDSTFRLVFDDIRAHASGGPPYHSLPPVGLRIKPLAPGIVLVTFELHNAERLGRRTVVFRREGNAWKIFHLHASNIAVQSGRP
ncbi:MAG TPA: nuclear transport factor 2 family protein [Gemmatimonadaceae bacterium]